MYRNKKSVIYIPLVAAVSVVLGMFIGRYFGTGAPHERIVPGGNKKLNAILNYIEQKYVDTISPSDLVEKILPALFENLDPHSSYISAEEFQEVDDPLQGEFDGIGVQFNIQKDTVVVIQVIAGGPSERVSLKAGDRIVTVNDSVIAGTGIRSNAVVKLLKGPKGTKVRVGIVRKGVEGLMPFDIKRDKIPFYSVDVSYCPVPGTGYMKISRFAATTYDEFNKHLSKLRQSEITELIIDLRGNGGGFLNAASLIANEFLSKGQTIVYTEGRAEPRRYYRATGGGSCTDLGVTVLIDEGTASASEILAGAIQDNDRGTVIGRRSFGKGLVMEQQELPDGSAVRLTVSRYYTPTGRCIQKPYEMGHKDYYAEIENRYEHGEFYQMDSIHFPDSLKYTTPKGKLVYGGGGIMPDVFVPIDTVGFTRFLSAVTTRGLIYDFCFDYTDSHRDELSRITKPEGFADYVIVNKLASKFMAFAESKGFFAVGNERRDSDEYLRSSLAAFLARNTLSDEGFYPLWLKTDDTFNAALNDISKKNIR